MGTAAAIATAIASIVGLTWWLLKRKAAKADDPIQQKRNREDEFDRALARGADGVADVNRLLDDELRADQDAAPGPASGPDDSVSSQGGDLRGEQ